MRIGGEAKEGGAKMIDVECKQRFESLREEYLDLYRYGQSRALRCALEIWAEMAKLLSEVGLNKIERLAVCNALIEEANLAQKEE